MGTHIYLCPVCFEKLDCAVALEAGVLNTACLSCLYRFRFGAGPFWTLGVFPDGRAVPLHSLAVSERVASVWAKRRSFLDGIRAVRKRRRVGKPGGAWPTLSRSHFTDAERERLVMLRECAARLAELEEAVERITAMKEALLLESKKLQDMTGVLKQGNVAAYTPRLHLVANRFSQINQHLHTIEQSLKQCAEDDRRIKIDIQWLRLNLTGGTADMHTLTQITEHLAELREQMKDAARMLDAIAQVEVDMK